MPAAFTPFEQPEVVAGETFLTALTKSVWGRVAVLAVSGLLGLSAVLAAWALIANHEKALDTKNAAENVQPGTADPVPADGRAISAATDSQFNRRWLPEQTQLLIDLRLSRIGKEPAALESLAYLGTWWQPSRQALLSGLRLGDVQVHRMTWATTDLADCVAHSVVVLELEPGADAYQQLPSGQGIDLGAKLVAHRLPSAADLEPLFAWPHPAMAVDAHTIVTGREEDLRKLIARGGDGELASPGMELLLKNLSPTGDLAVMVSVPAAMPDLPPIRTSLWSLPANLLDVWPAGKMSWHLLCDAPAAVGLSVQSAADRRCELGLVCKSETTAETIRLEVEKLVPAAIAALPAHLAALKDTLAKSKVPAEAADQYSQVLNRLLRALQNQFHCDTSDGIIWLRFGWEPPGFLASASALLECKSARNADWLASAKAADETTHRGLLSGLLRYVKVQTPPSFPEAAAGDMLLMQPETRLSWLSEILPYLGHPDWHVEPGYNWKDPHNGQIVKRVLPEVVNPRFGPGVSPSGYPVTHYVGVAGIGRNAAQLPAGDPHAGVFGYGRQTRPQDLDRGGTHTIAVLGVQDQLGPWAQGGPATTRALTERPYCNGPDGFGSGQRDGMTAGFADGSVRFLSDKIDPEVMERLASIHGGAVDAAQLEPKSSPADLIPMVLPIPGSTVPGQPGPKPVVPEPRLPPIAKPAEIDPKLQAMLDVPIGRIMLPNVPLGEAVKTVAAIGNFPVSFDPDAMEELGVSFLDSVTIDLNGTAAGKTLEEIAAKRNMAVVVENGQILLTSPADHREKLRQINYTVTDLTGGNAKVAELLAHLIERLVAPDSWQTNGGYGTVEILPDVLRIRQTSHVHYQIIVLCEKLRVARGMRTKSSMDPKKFDLTTHSARAKAILGKAVSVGLEPNPSATLGSIIERIKQALGCEILIDRPALASIGVTENTACKFKAEKQPLGEALAKMLGPLDLAWRAVDANTLQVTTRKAVIERRELEFYPVARTPAGQQPPAALIERIKAGLHGAVWDEGVGAGSLFFDPLSQSLIVFQSQPRQREIEAMLAK
jgi:hypothetical protein